MGSPEFAVAPGKKQYIGKAEVEAVQQPPEAPPRHKFDVVSRAEADHLTVGHILGVGASLAVVGRSSGFVIPDKYNATMASAHREGASHDRALVQAHDDDPDHHNKEAESIISNNIVLRNDLATALYTERSMGRARILSVIDESRRNQEERAIPRATLFVKNEDGSRETVDNVKVENGSVAVPDKVVNFSAEKPSVENEGSYDVSGPRMWSEREDIRPSETAVLSQTEQIINAEYARIQAVDAAMVAERLEEVRDELAHAA